MTVAVGQHAAPAQPAIKGQRAAHVHVAVVVVITAGTHPGFSLPLVGRTLAHHVDGGRWVARTGGQAGGAAYHLDSVVNDGVGIGLHVAEGIEHPVDLEVGDAIAACRVGGAVRVIVLHHDAGGLAQRFGQGVEVEVVHLLAGDHRDRLRGFLDGQVQARGGAHGPGGVGTGVLGIGARVLGGDADGGQFERCGRRLLGIGFSQQLRAEHAAEEAEGEGDGTGEGRKHCGRLLFSL